MSLEELDEDPKTLSKITRSASYAELPQETKPSNSLPSKKSSISRSFSENVLPGMQGTVSRTPSNKQESGVLSKKRRSLRRLSSIKRKTAQGDSNKQYVAPNFILGADEGSDIRLPVPGSGQTPEHERKTRSVSSSISNFARRSWMSNSRSPSPSPSKQKSRQKMAADIGCLENELTSKTKDEEYSNGPNKNGQIEEINGSTRRDSMLSKRSRRPLSQLISKTNALDTPDVPAIPKSFSTEKLPSLKHKTSEFNNAPAVPRTTSSDRLQSAGADTPRKKDPLWSTFRNLDGEYSKFQSRPSTLKTTIVRSALLPFLRNPMDTASLSTLRPEDVDRRTVILNKWWTGLLEMLNGRHGESVSGNDRPSVLEAATALMVRPEWNLPPLTATARNTKTPRASLKSRSTTSLRSTLTMSSDFLAESVYHNVKNTFTQNLLAQMAYAVDKMSARSVPASIVTFCGKAAAYAFYYCEGVAEILVRLWSTTTEAMRRILGESGFRKEGKLNPSLSDRICAAFPSCLHSLKFTGLRSLTSYLRSRPHLPFATTYIPWHGPWMARWAGRDTDLFFVFIKYYTELFCRFMPENASPEEMLAAPGWLLVQAQILTAIDSTIQRASTPTAYDQVNGPSSITFDEMLTNPDATATILPLPPNGAARSMAENRLIMAVRDSLLGAASISERAQTLIARSFSSALKAAAQGTSLFDHNACFALCDFLEEAIVILSRYEQSSAITTVDWPFWITVCKAMLQSQNSITEVRLISFVYSLWPTIIRDKERRREICLDWLLTPETFYLQFCHWCPMVRAFFMRLLVWRVARFDGSTPDYDFIITKMLAERLQVVWRNYLFLQELAEKNASIAPSTAACTPAPGRRLFIVRNDVQPTSNGAFMSFDGILSSVQTAKNNPYERHSARDPFAQGQSKFGAEDMRRPPHGGKKRWSLFKSILLTSTSSNDDPKPDEHHAWPNSEKSNVSLKTSPTKPADTVTGPKPNGVYPPRGSSRTNADAARIPISTHQTLSFRFSLEWADREIAPVSKERRLHAPRLPTPAQMLLQSRQVEVGDNCPLKPEDMAAGASKYGGRALAEWAALITECQNFFERRRAEGVPSYQLVETPMLGVEPFRKL